MPAEPILTRISRDIVQTLAGVKSPSYRTELHPEMRSMAGNSIVDGLAVVVPGSANRAGGDGSGEEAMGFNEWRQTYFLICYFGQSQNSDRPIDERLADAITDIEKALTFEEDSFRRGGYAIGTFINSVDPFDDEDNGMAGLMIEVTVEYRYPRGSPYVT